jgi:hypothetical protein
MREHLLQRFIVSVSKKIARNQGATEDLSTQHMRWFFKTLRTLSYSSIASPGSRT